VVCGGEVDGLRIQQPFDDLTAPTARLHHAIDGVVIKKTDPVGTIFVEELFVQLI
tara:strand:- start:181 stop:345 length:165 start_codon:yes stop_codon:yes gene_type:complete